VYVVVVLVIVVVVVVLVVGGGCRSCGPMRVLVRQPAIRHKNVNVPMSGLAPVEKPWTTNHTAIGVERDVSLAISWKNQIAITNVVEITLSNPTEITLAGRCTWDRDVRDG
jgi:hypothetical protein